MGLPSTVPCWTLMHGIKELALSIRIMSEVWAFATQKGSKLLLLLAIADFADDHGRAFPSVPTLAKKTRLSVRNVQYMLKALEDEGALKIALRPHRSSLYTVLRPWGENFAPGGGENFAPGGATQRRKVVQPIAPRTVIEPDISKNDEDLKKGLTFLTPGSIAYESSKPKDSDEGEEAKADEPSE